MIPQLVLRPLLDALAPEDPAAAGRRIRNTAIWLSISAWLLPAFPGLGTDTTAHRAWICAAFVAAAVAAQFRHAHRWARVALPVVACATAAIVAWLGHGAMWGLAFVAFSALVVSLTEARRRFVRLPPPVTEPDPLPPNPGVAPRVLNALAWLGVSVLILKQWAGQAMVVPTGSMQPTIMGAREPRAAGDHLFVDNFSYLFRDPRRWEIVVFEFPLFRERYFVKRVVGLPGERVEITDGDLWVDGRIARKPPVVQETLWRELFPRASFVAKRKAINDGFQPDLGTGGTWSRVSEQEMRCVPGGETSFAFFKGSATYPDVRVAFSAAPDGSASVVARITARGTPVTLTLRAAGDGALAVGKRGVPVAASLGASARVELCVADGEAWALVDGREVARTEFLAGGRGRNRVEIGAGGAPVNFRDVRVDRDIVYEAGGGPGVYDVPANGFFFIGDHVAESDDSRRWTAEVFHPPGGAPALAAKSRVPSETGADVPNVSNDGTMWRFRDVDGVRREIPVAGTTVDHNVPRPFARREHLVGRAIMVFWPWAPAEAGFRPRLLP